MKATASILSVSIVLISSIAAIADDANESPAVPDKAAMEKLMAEWAKLAPEHEVFKKLAGKWNTITKNFYENPEEPTPEKGKATFKLLMGGRFLQQTFNANFGGKKFEGMGVTGYDKSKGKLTSVWFDNMGTGLMHTTGELDKKSGTMTEVGEASSPLGNVKMRNVSEWVDDDKFIFTMYMAMPGGSETKAMEIIYTRAKPSKKAEKKTQ